MVGVAPRKFVSRHHGCGFVFGCDFFDESRQYINSRSNFCVVTSAQFELHGLMNKCLLYFLVITLQCVSLDIISTADDFSPTGKTLIFRKNYDCNDNESALAQLGDEIIEKTSNGECRAESSLFGFDIDDTVLTHQTSQIREIRGSAAMLKNIQTHGIATIAITARSVVDTYDHSPEARKTIQLIENGEMIDESIRKHELYRKIDDLQDDFHRADDINPSPGSTLFNTSHAFYDSSGAPANEGFFTYSGPEFPKVMATRNVQETSQIMYYGNGLLMVSGRPKGEALKKLLTRTDLGNQFKCIFFVDDTARNLTSMKQTFGNTYGMKVFLYKVPTYSKECSAAR
jgi:hypothetical protein